MVKVAVTGRPGVGKTTTGRRLAEELGVPLLSTDDLLGQGYDWQDLPRKCLDLLGGIQGGWVVEGCLVARLLERGLEHDRLILRVASEEQVELRPKHRALAKMVDNKLGAWIGPIELNFWED